MHLKKIKKVKKRLGTYLHHHTPYGHETFSRFRENYALSNGYTLGSESCENLEHLEQLDHFWCPNTAEVDFFERKFQNCIESLQIDSRLDIHRIYAFWAVDFFNFFIRSRVYEIGFAL